MRVAFCEGLLINVVLGAERVENHVAVRQQVLTAFLRQSNGIGEHLDGVFFGQVGDGIETRVLGEIFDEVYGRGGEGFTECTNVDGLMTPVRARRMTV